MSCIFVSSVKLHVLKINGSPVTESKPFIMCYTVRRASQNKILIDHAQIDDCTNDNKLNGSLNYFSRSLKIMKTLETTIIIY